MKKPIILGKIDGSRERGRGCGFIKDAKSLTFRVLSRAANDVTFWRPLIHGVSIRVRLLHGT